MEQKSDRTKWKEKIRNMVPNKRILILTTVLFIIELLFRIWQTVKQLESLSPRTSSTTQAFDVVFLVLNAVQIALLVLIIFFIYRQYNVKKKKEHIIVVVILILTTILSVVPLSVMGRLAENKNYANIKETLELWMIIIAWVTLPPYLGIVSYYAWKYTHHNKTKPQVSQTLE